MRDQFVPYSIAIKLQEKGFNERCLAGWEKTDKWEGLHFGAYPITWPKAPLWEQALEFLDKKDLAVNPHPVIFTSDSSISGWIPTINNAVYNHRLKFKTRTEALKAGIEKALELI
jgi:hypothetical protein